MEGVGRDGGSGEGWREWGGWEGGGREGGGWEGGREEERCGGSRETLLAENSDKQNCSNKESSKGTLEVMNGILTRQTTTAEPDYMRSATETEEQTQGGLEQSRTHFKRVRVPSSDEG